jgi:hypothetical protein
VVDRDGSADALRLLPVVRSGERAPEDVVDAETVEPQAIER